MGGERAPHGAVGDAGAPVSAPPSVRAKAASDVSVEISWDLPSASSVIAAFEVRRDSATVGETAGLSVTESGLQPWREYCYTVRSIDAQGRRSEPSAPVCARTLDGTPPTAPAKLEAVVTGDRAAALSWEAASDAASAVTYEVLRAGEVVIEGPGTSARDAGLAPGRTYCWVVRARDEAGNRSEERGPACATTPDLTPPSSPSALAARAVSETELELAWTASSDDVAVAQYEVQREGTVVASVPGSTPKARVSGLKAGAASCYTVRAADRAGNRSAAAGPACATTLDLTAPSAARRPRARALPGAPVEVAWDAATDNVGVVSYEVRRDAALLATVTGLSLADPSPRPGVKNCWSVVAIDASGNRSAEASACAVVPDVTPPSTPSGLVATPRSERQLDLRWNASIDDVRVAEYEILSGGRIISKLPGTFATIGGLRAAVTVCYTVRARDGAGNVSAESAKACATMPDLTPPESPPELAAAAASDTAVTLAWRPSADNVGTASYEVTRDGAVVASVPAPGFTEARLKPWTHYCYEVRALDAAGNRSKAAGPTCARTLDVTPPSRPGPLRIAALSGALEVSWNASTDDWRVVGYEVIRQGVPVAKVEAPGYTDLGLPARRHCYTVRAFDGAGNRSPESEAACAVPPDVTPPSVPEQLRLASIDETSAELRWDASSDNVEVTGYELLRGGKVVASAPTPAVQDGALAPWVEYCWTVRALDAAGNRSPETAPLCARTPDRTRPVIAGTLVASSEREDAMALRWPTATDNVGVVGYDVERDEIQVAQTTAPSLADAGLRAGTRYCYQVRARDAAGLRSLPVRACGVTADLTPPDVPAGLAGAPTATQIALRWGEAADNVGVTGYELLQEGKVVVQLAALTTIVSGLAPGTEHCYAVRARDAAGNRSGTAEPRCISTLDPTRPLPPRSLVAALTNTGVDLKWNPSPQEDVAYRVYADGRPVGATRYLTFAVKRVTRLSGCFHVTAVDAGGRESKQSNEACIDEAARTAADAARSGG